MNMVGETFPLYMVVITQKDNWYVSVVHDTIINLYLSQENPWVTSQHKVLHTEDAVTCCDWETVTYLESCVEHWLFGEQEKLGKCKQEKFTLTAEWGQNNQNCC